MKKDTKYTWTESCQISFDILKEKLITPPILAFPNFNLDFILSTDASIISCSGILANRDGKDERPIQYFSRSLNAAQSKYSTVELELLAIIWSVEWLRPYLYGRKFYIYTDHKPLIYLFSNRNMSSRLHRWRLLFMEYQFEILHREGKSNFGPDALSRIKLENNEIFNDEKAIFKVQTGSNTVLNQEQNQIEKYTPGQDKTKYYVIEEKNNLIINSEDYDLISNSIYVRQRKL